MCCKSPQVLNNVYAIMYLPKSVCELFIKPKEGLQKVQKVGLSRNPGGDKMSPTKASSKTSVELFRKSPRKHRFELRTDATETVARLTAF